MGAGNGDLLKKKAVSEVISMLLVVMMGIALTGTVYMWGMPMVSKRQDTAKADRLYTSFDRSVSNSFVRKMDFVAKNGGEDTFTSDVKGMWTLHEYDDGTEDANSLDFLTFSKVSNIAITDPSRGIGWVALTPGGTCPPESGIVGLDPAYVVCARAEPFENGYNILYRIWFRKLYDTSGEKGYKINLVKDSGSTISSTSKSVKITRGQVTTQTDGETLITTEIKILLV